MLGIFSDLASSAANGGGGSWMAELPGGRPGCSWPSCNVFIRGVGVMASTAVSSPVISKGRPRLAKGQHWRRTERGCFCKNYMHFT